jgi:DNA polymerase V
MCGTSMNSESSLHTNELLDLPIEGQHSITAEGTYTYFILVKGEAMKAIGIFHHDLLVVDRSAKPSSQDLVVASIGGELRLKKLHKTYRGKYFLLPAHSMTEALEVTKESEVYIWGVVTHAVRTYQKEETLTPTQ